MPPQHSPSGPTPRAAAAAALRARVGMVLDRGMVEARISAKALSALLERDHHDHIDEKIVSDYRRGRTLLPLHLAQQVGRALALRDEQSSQVVLDVLGYDPMVMIRAYGLLPATDHDELLADYLIAGRDAVEQKAIALMLDVERLRQEIETSEARLAELERAHGSVSLVQAAADSNRYAAAVWPVLAGPPRDPTIRVHVSDRIDFKRLDGQPLTDEDVRADLRLALARAGAVRSFALPRWSGFMSASRTTPDRYVSRWNIRRLDAPRPPRIQLAHSGFPAVALSATTSNTWLGYVASMVSFVLGYGLTSTADVAAHDGQVGNERDANESRNRVHLHLLRHPGDRRVWYHAGLVDRKPEDNPWIEPDQRSHGQVLRVRLVEDDRLFESTSENRRKAGIETEPDIIAKWRASRDRALEMMPAGDPWNLCLPVEDAEWGSDKKWAVTVDLAVNILAQLERLGLRPLDALEGLHDEQSLVDPAVAGPVLRWMQSQGAPFVRMSPVSLSGAGHSS